MNGHLEPLGIAQVDINYVRIQSCRDGWVYVRVPVTTRGKSNSLEIADNRPAVVKAAERVFAVSADINAAKRKKQSGDKRELEAELEKALEEFRSVFNTPAIVSVQDQFTVGGQTSYQRVILNDAEEDEPEAIFSVIRTHGLWHRDPLRSPFVPVFGDKERTTALHPVFANGEGVAFWELGRERIRTFQVSFPEGFSTMTYEKVIQEEKPEEEKIEVSGQTVRVEAPDVGPAKPEEDAGLLKEVGFTNGDLEKLNAVGISSVNDLLEWTAQDIEELASETGISKTKLTRAARKIRKSQG